ncbi:MOSC domain-containing protein [Actinomycetota bacterium]
MMRLTQIWRYPVKSLGGESLDLAAVDERGLAGDRGWAAVTAAGKLGSGKNTRRFARVDGLFGLTAGMPPAGSVPLIAFPDGRRLPADDPATSAALSRHCGVEIGLRPEAAVSHFDEGPISLVGTASLRALAELAGDDAAADVRHFRTNLVVETDQPWVEESWIGQEVQVGGIRLSVTGSIPRCRMVDIAQVGVPAHGHLLKTLGAHRDTKFAVYAEPQGAGTLRFGDAVEPVAPVSRRVSR